MTLYDVEWVDDEFDDDGEACTWCGGGGVQECDDPIQCTRRHFGDEMEPCSACRGSGLAKDQVIW